MKILIVSKIPSHPTTAGNRRFIVAQVDLFRKMGHNVYFLYVNEKPLFSKGYDIKDLTEMNRYWGNSLYIYTVPKFEKLYFDILIKLRLFFNGGYIKCDDEFPAGLPKYVNRLHKVHNFDCCIINYYVLSKLFLSTNFQFKAISTHDYFSYRLLLLNDKKSWLPTTADQEAKALQRCPNIFALNSDEAIYFKKLSPLSRVYNIYSLFDFTSSPVIGNKNILFFSSSNRYSFNGIKWFLNEIFPMIIAQHSDAKLIVGGSICKLLANEKLPRHVELYGYVDNPKDFFALGDVSINPTFQGTGLKIKTFESISYDKITIVHPHSIEGIFMPEKAPILASSSASDWVDYLTRIWNDSVFIDEIKARNKRYIDMMNSYIIAQYKEFFKK